MKETEILRGLDKARAKHAARAQKFAEGVAQVQPSPFSLKGLARAATTGYNNAVGATTDLMERKLGGVRQFQPLEPTPAPVPAAPVIAAPAPAPAPAPVVTSPFSGGVGGATSNNIEAMGQKYGFADGVAQVQPSPFSLKGLARAATTGYNNAVEGATNLMERAMPIQSATERYNARMAAQPVPAPAPAPAPVVAAPVPAPSPLSGGVGGVTSNNIEAMGQKYGFRRGVAELEGPGTETSDDIPAMLSKVEAVLPAKTVDAVGPKNIARLIEATNGKPPVDGIKHGLHAASGAIPGIEVEEFGPVRGAFERAKVAGGELVDKVKSALPARAPVSAPPAAPVNPRSYAVGSAAGKVAGAGLRASTGLSAPELGLAAGELMTGNVGASPAEAHGNDGGATTLSGKLYEGAKTSLVNPLAFIGTGVGEQAGKAAAWAREKLGIDKSYSAADAMGVSAYENTPFDQRITDLSNAKPAPMPAPTSAPKGDDRNPHAAANEAMLANGGLNAKGQITRDGNSYSGTDVGFDPNRKGLRGTLSVMETDPEAAGRNERALAMLTADRKEREAGYAANQAANSALLDKLSDMDKADQARTAGLNAAARMRQEARGLTGRNKVALLTAAEEQERRANETPISAGLERAKTEAGNADAKARLAQTQVQHADNMAQRTADREQRAQDSAERRILTLAGQQRQAQQDRAAGERKNYEESAKDFANLFTTPDGKRDENAEAMSLVIAERNSGGRYRTMSPAERAKHREDAIETVKFINAARNGQNNSWMQALGLTNPDAVLDYLPQLKGRKLEKAGVWEGATTPNASIGDYVIRMPGGKDMYLPYNQLSEGTLSFLKRQGVQIGG